MPLVPSTMLYGENNVARTASLFTEMAPSTERPIFSLGRGPGEGSGIIPLRDLYVNYCVDDPTETVFAEEVFGDLFYWEQLKKASFMGKYLPTWRLIVDAKRKSRAFKSLVQKSKNGDVMAAKYLIDEPWKKGVVEKTKARKTTKAALEGIDDDLARLREEGII